MDKDLKNGCGEGLVTLVGGIIFSAIIIGAIHMSYDLGREYERNLYLEDSTKLDLINSQYDDSLILGTDTTYLSDGLKILYNKSSVLTK
ncbi:hypothetical protein H8D36_06665 [archaeon]|nr:hypothetical protein [archaeon]